MVCAERLPGARTALEIATTRNEIAQTKAAGAMILRSSSLFDARLPVVLATWPPKQIHVATRRVDIRKGEVTAPALARTIHAAELNSKADAALANLRRNGKTLCAPPQAAFPNGFASASRTWNPATIVNPSAPTIDAEIAMTILL